MLGSLLQHLALGRVSRRCRQLLLPSFPPGENNAIATTSTVAGKTAECVLGSSTVTACSGQNIGTGILGLVFSGLGSGTQILAFSGPLSSWGDSSSQFVCSSSL